MVFCKNCGGECKPVGKGMYRCTCCGTTFNEDDVASPKSFGSNVSTKGYDSGANVYEKNIHGVLEIRWRPDPHSLCSGSGFLISEDGYAITNTHVVTTENGVPCRTVSVSVAGEEVTADVLVLGDDKHGNGNGVDLALIRLNRIPQNVTVLRFANFNKLRIGEKVFVIGNSLGCGTCITSGIVSDKLRMVDGNNLMMTDCAVNNGNSGGPIFNESGLVIGAIVSSITNAEGMNFAIPVTQIEDFILRCNRGIRIKK